MKRSLLGASCSEECGGKGGEAIQRAPQQLRAVEDVPREKGINHMTWDSQGGNWQVPRQAKNEAWGSVWVTHAPQKWGAGIFFLW